MPLWLYVQQEASMAYLRTKNHEILPRDKLAVYNRPHTIGHRQKIQEFLQDLEYDVVETDDIEPTQNWDQHYIMDTTSFEDGIPDNSSTFNIYTDGSKKHPR